MGVSAPSFSLGLDLDVDQEDIDIADLSTDDEQQLHPHSPTQTLGPNLDERRDLGLEATDLPALKRLRRGLAPLEIDDSGSDAEDDEQGLRSRDELREDYFSSMKKSKAKYMKEDYTSYCSSKATNISASVNDSEVCHQQQSIFAKPRDSCGLTNSGAPSYKYFYHNDEKIQKLVKERLCHLNPTGTEVCEGTKPVGEDLNHMGLYSPRDSHSQATKTCLDSSEGTSRKGKGPDTTSNWINPRSSTGITKNEGKRRVHAGGYQQSQWFTADGGRKAYISKDGRELTGKMAYLQYMREHGSKFRKPKRNADSNKKPSATKKKR